MGQKSSRTRISGVKQWNRERDEWLQTLSRDQVLQELVELYSNGNFDRNPAFTPAERTELYTTYTAASYHIDKLTDRRTSQRVVPIMSKIWEYHSAYPFLPGVSPELDFGGFLRAVTLLTRKAYKFWGSGSKRNGQVLTRKKNPTDMRKLLFRSVAVLAPEHTVLDNEAEESRQQILDILACLQPWSNGSTAPLPRQQLEPTADRLCEQQTSLLSLAVPRQDMSDLMELLVACRNDNLPLLEPYKIAKAIQHMLNSFSFDDHGGVRWEVFNAVVEHIMPLLDTSIEHLMVKTYAPQRGMLLPSAFILREHPLYSYALPQFLTFLPKYVHQKLCTSSTSILSTHSSESGLVDLLDKLRAKPPSRPVVFLIRSWIGGEDLVFGAFLPITLLLDEAAAVSADTSRLLGRSLLFQLAPMQDVFSVRCKAAGTPWQSFHNVMPGETGGFSFGLSRADDTMPKEGVTLQIYGKHREKGIFAHSLDGKGVYSPSVALGHKRGNVRLEFEVQEIEVVAL
ncbi:MAG: hypothetical protein LQ337_007660 [Flavoplaca oasis]|nr:MAG: hypothetical protein LQ337_007660 [Flavoplaca oasis]